MTAETIIELPGPAGADVAPAVPPADPVAELEAAWLWTDALDGHGDPQPARSWPELSATHGS